MSDIFYPEPEKFLLTFPIWRIENPAKKVNGLFRIDSRDGDVALPIFTDEYLANSFFDDIPLPHDYKILPITHPMTFLGLLVILESKRYTHVLIDPANGKRNEGIPVTKLRSDAVKWFD